MGRGTTNQRLDWGGSTAAEVIARWDRGLMLPLLRLEFVVGRGRRAEAGARAREGQGRRADRHGW